jgi:hypothetical protein
MYVRTLIAGALIACALLLQAVPARAEANNGLGMMLGYANHTTEDSSPVATYHSVGATFGLDYQFALGGLLSINPVFQFTFESGSNLGSTTHRSVGLEGRIWLGNTFVGAQAAHITEFRSNFFGATTSGDGSGTAVTLGYQTESKLFIELEVNHSNVDFGSGNSGTISGYRVILGLRLK